MGGRLWVDSEVGYGSTFHFTARLPLVAGPVPVRPQGALDALAGKHALVVDDNATNREILAYQLRSWGMTNEASALPATALNWVREGKNFDLVILDMQMPEMDGLTLAEGLRALPGGAPLPLLMLTSLGEREVRADAAGLARSRRRPCSTRSSRRSPSRVGQGCPDRARPRRGSGRVLP